MPRNGEFVCELVPKSDEGLGRVERAGGGCRRTGSAKTPSSGGRDSVSASQDRVESRPPRALPLHRLNASSARVSVSEISEPRPEVVTESERAYMPHVCVDQQIYCVPHDGFTTGS